MISLILTMAVAQAGVPERPAFDLNLSKLSRVATDGCFPSGLHVFMRQEPIGGVASVTTVIDRGYLEEPPGFEGAATVLAYASLEATLPDGTRILDRLTSLGADTDVWVTQDLTVFTTTVAVDDLPAVFEIDKVRLTDPLAGVDDAALARAKARYTLELTASTSVPTIDLPRYTPKGFFGAKGAPTGVGPTAATVAKVDRAALKRIATAYAPQGTSILVTGARDGNTVGRELQLALGNDLVVNGPDGKPRDEGACVTRARQALTEPVAHDPRESLQVIEAPVTQPTLMVSWAMPASFTDDMPTMLLLRDRVWFRLGESMRGVSFEEHSRFAPRCDLIAGVGATTLACTVTVPPDTSPDKLRKQLLTASFYRPQADDIDAESALKLWVMYDWNERNAANMSLAVVGSPLQSAAGLTDVVATHITQSPWWYLNLMAGFGKAAGAGEPVANLHAWEDTWAGPAHAAVSLLVPFGADQAAILAAKKGPARVTGKPKTRYGTRGPDDAPARHGLLGKPVAAPLSGTAPTLAWEEGASHTLANGVRVDVVPWGEAGAMRMAAVALGGADTEPVAGTAAWLWDLTVAEDNHVELPTKGYKLTAGMLGLDVRAQILPQGQVVALEGQAGNLDAAAWTLRAMVEGLQIDGDGGYRNEARQFAADQAAAEAATPVEAARIARWSHVLGAGHRAVPQGAAARALAAQPLSDKDARGVIERVWHPKNVRIVVVGGQLDPKAVFAAMDKMFGDWAEKGDAYTVNSPMPAPQRPAASALATLQATTPADTLGLTCSPDVPLATMHVGAELLRAQLATALGDRAAMAEVSVVPFGAYALVDGTATLAKGQGKAVLDAWTAGIAVAPTAEAVARARHAAAARWATQFLDLDDAMQAAVAHGSSAGKVVADLAAQMAAVSDADAAAFASSCAATAGTSLTTP